MQFLAGLQGVIATSTANDKTTFRKWIQEVTEVLILSRKLNEIIRIGDDVVIRVVEFCGDKIRLGIDAPRSVSVHRGEVYDAIQLNGDRSRFNQNNDENTEVPS